MCIDQKDIKVESVGCPIDCPFRTTAAANVRTPRVEASEWESAIARLASVMCWERRAYTERASLSDVVSAPMTSRSSYEPIATESDKALSRPSPGWRHHLVNIRRLFLFAGAFCLVAIAVYKAGQWSIEKQDPLHNVEQSDKVQDQDIASSGLPVDSSNMSRNGKYSVG